MLALEQLARPARPTRALARAVLAHPSSTLTLPASPQRPPHLVPPPHLVASPQDPALGADPGSSQTATAYLWFDHVYPIRFAVWDIRHLFSRLHQGDTLDRLRQSIPRASPLRLEVDSVDPRAKDGGAFVRVRFALPNGVQADDPVAANRIVAHLESITNESLDKHALKPWYSLGRPSRAFLVRGEPWMEDMNRFPSREIRVDVEGSEIPQEELYQIFRPYGKIHDIVPVSPKQARIIYTSIRSAASARNCLHAASTSAPHQAVLRILYADAKRSSYVKDFATSHPRITIPLIVALLGTISYAVFDPIRELSVMAKVEGTFDADQWAAVRWLKRETIGRLADHFRLSGKGAEGMGRGGTGIEKEREEAREALRNWLVDRPDTFVVVTGPQGSGKTALVDEVLADGKNVLTIDCNQLLKNARSDTKLVTELASAVGYRPNFVFAASLSNMIDLASMGLIGQKAGFSATLDAQLKSILEVTASALSRIASATQARAAAQLASDRSRREHEQQREAVVEQLRTVGVRDARVDAVAGSGIVAELGGGVEGPSAVEQAAAVDEKEEVEIVGPRSSAVVRDAAASASSTSMSSGDGAPVERLPVVVIKGFAAKGEAKQEVLWDVLSEWAAVLVENQVAHVVFTSESATLAKPLARALPSKPFNVITLTDASPEASLQYVAAKLASFKHDLPSTAFPAVARLGGRQTDLDLLVQKTRAGQDVGEAVDDIVQRNASELRKNLFGDDQDEADKLKWSRSQAWALVKALGDKGELKYNETLLTTFGGDDAPLRALEAASLIAVHHHHGRPSLIRPGKPVYRAACARLVDDAPFRAAIEYRAVEAGLKAARADVETAEKGLIELSALFTGDKGRWAFGGGATVPPEVEVRVGELLAKMRGAQDKMRQLGDEKKRLLEVLKED
ncbi:hypothetical protein JCM9279_004412 [Rhodotorula babjevae]